MSNGLNVNKVLRNVTERSVKALEAQRNRVPTEVKSTVGAALRLTGNGLDRLSNPVSVIPAVVAANAGFVGGALAGPAVALVTSQGEPLADRVAYLGFSPIVVGVVGAFVSGASTNELIEGTFKGLATDARRAADWLTQAQEK